MERNERVHEELSAFVKVQQKLNQAKRYRENNMKRLAMLKDEMRKVRNQMEEVNRQQNLALHKVVTGRNKG